jgi:hypothetical protein
MVNSPEGPVIPSSYQDDGWCREGGQADRFGATPGEKPGERRFRQEVIRDGRISAG